MSSRKSPTSPDVARRLQEALEQAQRLGGLLAERLDERFGDEMAALKSQGKRVLRRVRDRSRALNERVQSDDYALPQLLRETSHNLDALVQKLAGAAESPAAARPPAAAGPEQAAAAHPGGSRPRRRRKPGGGRRPRRSDGEPQEKRQPGHEPPPSN